MDALTFLKTYGSNEAERVAKAAGTNLAYFRQIAHGHRQPSNKLAHRLVRASARRLQFTALRKDAVEDEGAAA